METKLLPKTTIRNNVISAMAGLSLTLSVILGIGGMFAICLLLKSLNLPNPLENDDLVTIIGLVIVIAALFLWLILYNEYSSVIKHYAKLTDSSLIVRGRKGSKEFALEDLRIIHFSGKTSELIESFSYVSRHGTAIKELYSSMLTITLRYGEKHDFAMFFISVDPESFIVILEELAVRYPNIEIT